MTAISIAQAIKEIATVYTLPNGTANLELPNKKFDVPADGTPWAKLTLVHSDESQASLSDENGQRRWRAHGLGTISLMSKLGSGTTDAYNAAEAVRNLYRGKRTPSDVWFRNVRIEERDARGFSPPPKATGEKWFQIDVMFEFEYDQIS